MRSVAIMQILVATRDTTRDSKATIQNLKTNFIFYCVRVCVCVFYRIARVH